MAAIINLNSKAAQELKLAHLTAAANGDSVALLAWADWLEDNGSDRAARSLRGDVKRFCSEDGGVWYARMHLGWMADGLVKQATAFSAFSYGGNRRDGRMVKDDGSLEYALANGYVPTLSRSKARQEKLGRIIEALGYRVFWRD